MEHLGNHELEIQLDANFETELELEDEDGNTEIIGGVAIKNGLSIGLMEERLKENKLVLHVAFNQRGEKRRQK